MFTETPTRRIGRRLLASPLVGALTTPNPIDRYLELVRPAFSLAEVRATVVAVRRGTRDSVTLTLKPNANWGGFRAGQFVQLAVEVDGVRHTRCFSPAGSEHARRVVELTVKAHEDGFVSRHLFERAGPGMVLGLSQADGEFVLPAQRPERMMLISGGSGITPVMAMLRSLCDESHAGPVTFLHYAPTPAEAIYADELDDLAARHGNLRVLRAYTRAATGDLAGHLTRDHVLAAEPEFAGAETFACGPAALLEAVEAEWEAAGIGERLHTERFQLPAPAAIPDGDVDGVLRFDGSGVEVAASGHSLLEQAEAAGLRPVHGCRMGICHTCTCRKRSGAVRNLVTGEVSDAPDTDIRICVSAPIGDVTLDL